MEDGPIELGVLGPIRVARGEATVRLSPAQRRLVGALLAGPGATVSAERLSWLLWGDQTPDDPSKALQMHVSRLRAALRRLEPVREVIRTDGAGYRVDLDSAVVDSVRFERLIRAAESMPESQAAQRIAVLDEALALWRGAAFAEDSREDFAHAAAVHLEERRLAALELRADAMLALGRHGEVIAELEALVEIHPLRERLRAQLMTALYRAGRTPEALRVYQDARVRLAEELGLEPSPELKELEVRILQQEADFVPAGRAVPSPGNLPGSPTSLVGRTDELRQLHETLDRARLVTLTGPGGVGKTRLSLELARRRSSDHGGGVWLCELAEVRDAAGVAASLATTLGVRPSAPDLRASLIDSLRTREVLLLLDNCEHVIDEVASFTSAVLRECPDAKVLATSRDPLCVPGEHVWQVRPLDSVGAAELFVDRARAASPTFAPGDAELRIVDLICGRLDGLPLAIELAAPRLRSLTLAEALDGLENRFELLRARHADGERHTTLEAVVDWSYRLLRDDERELFDGVSVFTGPFTAEDAATVCARGSQDIGRVRRLLGDLVDHSLVEASSRGAVTHYTLLETLREFGRARLHQRGLLETSYRCHAQHFTALAEQADQAFRGPEQVDWMPRLTGAFANLRAAHAWAVQEGELDLALRMTSALHDYAFQRALDEVFVWAETAIAMDGAAGHPLHPAACACAAQLARVRGDGGRARALAGVGLESSSNRTRMRALSVLGLTAIAEGRIDECVELAQQRLRLAVAADDAYERASAFQLRALAHTYGGAPGEAIEDAEQALRWAEQSGSPALLGWARYAKGEALRRDDPERALELFEQSLHMAHDLGVDLLVGAATLSAASLRGRHGDPFVALENLRETIRRWHEAGHWRHQWPTLRCLVEVLSRLGRWEQAAVLHAAVTSDRATPLYGEDEQHMADVAMRLEAEMEREDLAAARTFGLGIPLAELVPFALDAIDDARRGDRAQHVEKVFMFTDIERSTALTEAMGDDAWDALLRWHDRLLGEAIRCHGGDIVKHEGDGFFAAFDDAGKALQSAVTIQRELARHRRDHGFAPQVRIGLHAGEVVQRDSDYFGLAVATAARVMALARGGEIRVTRQVAGDRAVRGDEEVVEVKGVSEPVRVLRLAW